MSIKLFLRSAGAALLCAAAIWSAYNLTQVYGAGKGMDETNAKLAARINEHDIVPEGYSESVIPDYILNPAMEMPTEEIDGLEYVGKISMPGYSKDFPVINEWSYDNLNIAPCRYEGSAYQNNLVILAHNYPGQFDFIKDMAVGDLVLFTDVDGNEFGYETTSIRTLKPEETDKLYDEDWDLSLFTCTSTGAARLVVGCQLVDAPGK